MSEEYLRIEAGGETYNVAQVAGAAKGERGMKGQHTDQQVRDFALEYVKGIYDADSFSIVRCDEIDDPEFGSYLPEWEVVIAWGTEDFTLSIQESSVEGKSWLHVATIDGTEPPYLESYVKAMESDLKDIAQIDREWRSYRHEGEGHAG